jgi:aspartate-semialdehyde dehydrogenase
LGHQEERTVSSDRFETAPFQIPAKGSGDKLRAGILGATGMVGQQLIRMLKEHPWFDVVKLAASPRSAGTPYEQAVQGRWNMEFDIPASLRGIVVMDAESPDRFVEDLDVVFSAVDLPKEQVAKLEHQYAERGVWVTSCNSALRMDPWVPMVVPYVNAAHLDIIPMQRKKMGLSTGALIAKSNCSIQSYVIPLEPLRKFGIKRITVHSEQAISGAGKTFVTWPDMDRNLIPNISGEEQKSETEPLKIWGKAGEHGIELAAEPVIRARCVRVGVQDGHTAHAYVQFADGSLQKETILESWKSFNPCAGLPSAAQQTILFVPDADRPQPRLDVMRDKGMGVTVGGLTSYGNGEFRFTGLSHNAILGAAGGAVLATEAAAQRGLIYQRTRKGAKAGARE